MKVDEWKKYQGMKTKTKKQTEKENHEGPEVVMTMFQDWSKHYYGFTKRLGNKN